MKKGFFTIEALGELVYEGYDLGRTWNGFALPYFMKETVELILNDLKCKWIYEEETDSYYVIDEENETFGAEIFADVVDTEDGKQKLYFFDGWMWEDA